MRVVPKPEKKKVDPLKLGPKATWAAYLPVALTDEVKRRCVEDGYKSASSYAEDLLVFALRIRERERLEDRTDEQQ